MNRRNESKPVTSLRRDCAQTIAEYERLLVGLRFWEPADPKKFPRYMEIAQEVIHKGGDGR